MLDNLNAAGAKYATKEKLKYDYVEKEATRWREMARVLKEEKFLSRLMIGHIGANSIFNSI